ncbi:hypothetical protein V1L52_13035 [Treponema sp. HNW]|uniref:hypothetical protein n=1 Tax=Treponema sp. HNW TaxID=3116654 RepID=UPI003D0B8623
MEKFTYKKHDANRILATAGALGALTVLLTVTRLGFIPWFSGAAITILHIPVILAVCLHPEGLSGLWAGTAVAAVFGLSSLVYAAVSPAGPIDPFFQNPLISVLPRILFGICTFLLYKAFSLICKHLPSSFMLLAVSLTAFSGTLLHAVFVLGALVIASAIPLQVMWAVLIGNSLLEAGAAVVLGTAVIGSVQGISKRQKSKLNSNQK